MLTVGPRGRGMMRVWMGTRQSGRSCSDNNNVRPNQSWASAPHYTWYFYVCVCVLSVYLHVCMCVRVGATAPIATRAAAHPVDVCADGDAQTIDHPRTSIR